MASISRWLVCAVVVLVIAGPACESAPEDAAPGKVRLYVGTYTGKKSKGIYRIDMDLKTGKLSTPELAAETTNPSFVALHPSGKFLYAVGEGGGKGGDGVSAFAIDAKTGNLTLLNQQSSGGSGPCHVTVDAKGKHVLAANYGAGSAIALEIDKDGKLGKSTGFVQHKGKGPNTSRQEGPHAHSINLDPANRFAFVADLGLDAVMVYRFDADKGSLLPNDPAALEVAPGAGPRHFAFHPSGKYAYVINELNSTIDALTYDPAKGVLKSVQTISTLPKGYKGDTTTAEVVVHPSGKFVYGSNRGHDSIAVFSVDEATGKLTFVEHQSDKVKIPRNFAIDPTGNFLVVGSSASDTVVVFRIDRTTGKLTPTGHTAEVGSPVCIRFLPIKE